MAIVFATFEDMEAINNRMQICEGKVAEIAQKLNELIAELKEKIKK